VQVRRFSSDFGRCFQVETVKTPRRSGLSFFASWLKAGRLSPPLRGEGETSCGFSPSRERVQ
jgi:hypothetical protein